MSLRREKNMRLYKKISHEYVHGTETIESCCNNNGITKQTYYNIKKRIEGGVDKPIQKYKKPIQQKESNTMYTPNSKSISNKNGLNRLLTAEDTVLELVPAQKNQIHSKRKHSKPSKEEDSDWALQDAIAALNGK